MGRIAQHVATMRGCSLQQIVDTIAQMEGETAELAVGAKDFDAFWQIWPHRVGKRAAEKAYAAARKRGNAARVILEGVERYIFTKPPDRPWLNPATFLNQDRFNDQPAAVSTIKHSKTSELRNDLSRRIGEGSEDTRPLRQLPQRQPYG
jgi:hypothetical protein